MALAEELQLLAFHAVATDTNEYRLRFLMRWYSKTFATPLHLVPSIPLIHVLQAFWEEKYESLDEDELEEERLRLLETEDQRRVRLVKEDAERVESEAFFAAVNAQAVAKKLEEVNIPSQLPVKTKERQPEPELSAPTERPPRAEETVSLKFVPTDFFDELVDSLESTGVRPEDQSSDDKLP